MKRVTAAGLACAALMMVVTGVTRAEAGSAPVGDVQAALDVLAGSSQVVAAIAEVYVDGKRVGRGSAGTRLIDGRGGKVPAGARFRVGSQTKQMTGVVVMRLVQEGRLALDDRLSDLLPQMAERDLVERADEITLRQLIQHTSGIPNWFTAELAPTFDFTTRYSPTELVRRSRTLPREQEPGEKFSYSNTNYMLLGLIIEKVTGHTVADEFDRRIFRPLGMTRTYLPTRFPGGVEGPHGHGYFPDESGEPRDVDRLNMSYGYAAGGVISTAHDISAFQRAFARHELLPKELQDVLMGVPREGGTPPPPQERLCGGEPALTAVLGSAPGFNAATYFSPDGRLQLAVSATLAVSNTDPSLRPLLDEVAEAVFCPAG
ncbi:beta-lactamase family protein [Nonomuraea sp. PA05]|uniref:serine hydrolase domain-containing protein n=1 Tax=Nonomuraea sp. PA05 TaxID=2604466 RepID=UPI0011D4AC42|nr:serine hydrolase domain-containing protein [Nonomuraea sp. PA05]TYB59806.1 beta-lactamase family protein [Nonomuraea sp. PA05]